MRKRKDEYVIVVIVRAYRNQYRLIALRSLNSIGSQTADTRQNRKCCDVINHGHTSDLTHERMQNVLSIASRYFQIQSMRPLHMQYGWVLHADVGQPNNCTIARVEWCMTL